MTASQFTRKIPHKTNAIKKLDDAISSLGFRPQYLLAKLDLINALIEAGRLAPIEDMVDLQYWLLDGDILVLEDEYEVYKYAFQLQTDTIVVPERHRQVTSSPPSDSFCHT